MMNTCEPGTSSDLPPREGTERLQPLDILLAGMRAAWRQNHDKLALDCAKIAAPYVHARRAPARGRLHGDLAALTDVELAEGLHRSINTD